MKGYLQYWVLLLIASISGYISYGQCEPRLMTGNSWTLFDSTVNKTVIKEHYLYASGTFNTVGKFTGGFNVINKRTGESPITSLPAANGTANAIPDGSGGFIIFGVFTKVGDSARTSLARVDAAGNIMTLSAVIDSNINAAVVYNGILYIGGYFNKVNGLIRKKLAAIDLATGMLTSWAPAITNSLSTGLPPRIECMQEINGAIYIGGAFSNVGTAARRNIAALGATTGIATSWAPEAYFSTAPAYGVVTKMLKVNNMLYICGQFDFTGGSSHPDVAAIDVNSGLAATWKPNTNSVVFSIAASGDTLYLGGAFYMIDGQPRQGFAAYRISTGTLLPIIINTKKILSEIVYDMTVAGDTVYLAGTFDTLNEQYHKNIAACNRFTGNVYPWKCVMNDNAIVRSVKNYYNRLYLGGTFFSIGRKERKNIACVDLDVDTVTEWYPKLNGELKNVSLGKYSRRVYISGTFTRVNDSARIYNAAVDNITGKTLQWDAEADNLILDVAEASKNEVYAGGLFKTVNGQPCIAFAKLNGSGKLIPSLAFTSANSRVSGLQIVKDKLYIGGKFTDIGGQPRTNLASIDLLTNTLTSWIPTADEVTVMKPSDTGILLGTQILFPYNSAVPRLYSMLLPQAPTDVITDVAYTNNTYYPVGMFDYDIVYKKYMRNAYEYVIGFPYTPFNQRIFTFYGNFPDTALKNVTVYGNRLFMSGGMFEDPALGIQNTAIFYLPQPVVDANIVTDTNGVCSGTKTLLRANSTVTVNTSYQWYVNGLLLNNSGPNCVFKPVNKDSVSCVVTVPGNGCRPFWTATTNSIIYTTTPTVTPTISIASLLIKEQQGNKVTVKANVKDAATGWSIEWFNKGVSIGKTTTDSIVYTKGIGTDSIMAVLTPRTDTCYVTDTSGRVIIEEEVVGIKQTMGDVSIVVYPNPFDSYVQLSGLNAEDVLLLYDVTGRKISANTTSGTQCVLQTGDLKTGVYVLKITDKHGALRKTVLLQKK